MASNDPRLEEKAADIIGLYMKRPQHAAVFCVDEKNAIQALDRLDPVLPMSRGHAERHGFEYFRHGTLSLFAALGFGFPRLNPMLLRAVCSRPSGSLLVSCAKYIRAYAKSARPFRWTYTEGSRRIQSAARK